MTFLKKSILLVTALLALSAHASDAPALKYEVRTSGIEGTAFIVAHPNETHTALLLGPELEYTDEATTVSVKNWKGMEMAGTTPAHDFVSCDKRTCTYGKKARIQSFLKVTLRPVVLNNVLMTSFHVVKSQATLKQVSKGLEAPMVETQQVENIVPLAKGSSYSVTQDSSAVAVLTLTEAVN